VRAPAKEFQDMHAPPFVQQESSACSADVNVGQQERMLSLGVGSLLLLNSLLGPKRTRPLSMLVGGGLLYRGWTGHCAGYKALGIQTNCE
jgi:uncharacterized membrane protein